MPHRVRYDGTRCGGLRTIRRCLTRHRAGLLAQQQVREEAGGGTNADRITPAGIPVGRLGVRV